MRYTCSVLNKLSALTLMLVIVSHAVWAGEPSEEDIAKVVSHADYADPRRFSAMLASINNMVTHYQNEFIDYDIRIVFVAQGIRFLTADKLEQTPFAEDSALAERRDELRGRMLSLYNVHEVKLELCEITRTEVNLPTDKLYPGVVAVPSGVVQIAELQRRGYSYLKIQ